MQADCAMEVLEYYKKYSLTVDIPVQIVDNEPFEVSDKYQLLNVVGHGAYGMVVAAKKDENLVAIKKILDPFDHKLYTLRMLRELKLLRLLKHDNIIDIKSVFLPKSRGHFDNVYIEFPLMAFDLTTIIKKEQLNEQAIQFMLYQLLRGLKYIHSAHVIHRDLKPKNILINTDCDLKICDFGLARLLSVNRVYQLTDYVQTRWYRAPELLMNPMDYTAAVDMWSVGCILAEMIRGKPIFPGLDGKNQIQLIQQVIGIHPYKGMNFDKLFPNSNPDGRDLLKKLLAYSPQDRITINEALQHPYMSDYHNPDDEPICVPLQECEFEFEQCDLTTEQLKDCVYEEILLYHCEEFREAYELKRKKQQTMYQHIATNQNKYINKDDEM